MSISVGSMKKFTSIFQIDARSNKSYLGGTYPNLYGSTNMVSGWNPTAAITSTHNLPDPFGGNTAQLLTASGASGSYTNQGHSAIIGNTYTRSIYAKAVTTGVLFFENYSDNGSGGTNYGGTAFNVSKGNITSIKSGDTPKISYFKDGWWRCACTRTHSIGSNVGTFYIGAYGTGTGSILLCRPQIEQTGFVPSWSGPGSRQINFVDVITKTQPTHNILFGEDKFIFDGTGSITTSVIRPSPTSNPTLYEMIIKPSQAQDYKGLIGASSYQNSGFFVGLMSNGIRTGVNTLGNSLESIYIFDYINKKFHLLVEFNGRVNTIYVNGIEVAQYTAAFDIEPSPNQLKIGGVVQGGWQNFIGEMEMVRIYQSTITTTEAYHLYESVRMKHLL